MKNGKEYLASLPGSILKNPTIDDIENAFDAGIKELHSIVENLKLQVSERQDRLDGVDKRNYELLEYIDRLKGLLEKEVREKAFGIKEEDIWQQFKKDNQL
jgi:hypothetical protein